MLRTHHLRSLHTNLEERIEKPEHTINGQHNCRKYVKIHCLMFRCCLLTFAAVAFQFHYCLRLLLFLLRNWIRWCCDVICIWFAHLKSIFTDRSAIIQHHLQTMHWIFSLVNTIYNRAKMPTSSIVTNCDSQCGNFYERISCFGISFHRGQKKKLSGNAVYLQQNLVWFPYLRPLFCFLLSPFLNAIKPLDNSFFILFLLFLRNQFWKFGLTTLFIVLSTWRFLSIRSYALEWKRENQW